MTAPMSVCSTNHGFFPPGVFIIQLPSTTVRYVDTTGAFSRQTSAGFPLMHIIAALHLHYSAMRDQHTALQMRNPVQDRLNGKAGECHYPALIGTPNTNPAYALCPFMTEFTRTHNTLPMVFQLIPSVTFCPFSIFFLLRLSVSSG